MTVRLSVLRKQGEASRFEREQIDDTRTAISEEAASALASDLRRRIEREVRFDRGSRALYATTNGSNYRQAPIGVAIPRNRDDVIATMELCRQYGAPLPRGGGTRSAFSFLQ